MYLFQESGQLYAPAALNCGTYFRWGWIDVVEDWKISCTGRESSQDSFVIQPVPKPLYRLHYTASCNSKLIIWFWENYLQLSLSRIFQGHWLSAQKCMCCLQMNMRYLLKPHSACIYHSSVNVVTGYAMDDRNHFQAGTGILRCLNNTSVV